MSLDDAKAKKLDKWAFWFLLLFAASDLFSISIAQTSAVLFVLLWLLSYRAERKWPKAPPLFWPFTAFIAISCVAAIFSVDFARSFHDSKDLFHIAIYFVACDLFCRDEKRTATMFRVAAFSGLAISAVGFAQAISRGIDINDRISGFFGHYMTFAGLLSLVAISTAALVLFDFVKWRDSWMPVALGFMVTAIVVSLTRNALIGVMVGGAIVVALRKPVALLLLPVVAVILFGTAPASVKDRITSIADPGNVHNRERLYLWGAGVKIIADYPVLGAGQDTFPVVYPKYRHPDVKEPGLPHLHNNFLQIASERGFTGFVSWLTIWIAAIIYMGKAFRQTDKENRRGRAALAASMAGVVAFHVAGMFEYNFGDSEIQMFLYLLLAAGISAGMSQGHPKELDGGAVKSRLKV